MPAICFQSVISLFVLQIFLGQYDVLPWLTSEKVVPMPWWLLLILIVLFWAIRIQGIMSGAFVGYAGGLSIGALMWYWDTPFKVAMVVGFGVANGIDRRFASSSFIAQSMRIRPPLAMVGALVAIVGRHIVVEGFGLYLGWLFLFICLPSFFIMAIDEAVFWLLGAGDQAKKE
mmetsp:Transcript_21177/g.38664  ORF Transcript_21177/g.38664 Transcript_21177/m.38664 type:complete len:173 (+) Transcript_21177:77-595(+)